MTSKSPRCRARSDRRGPDAAQAHAEQRRVLQRQAPGRARARAPRGTAGAAVCCRRLAESGEVAVPIAWTSRAARCRLKTASSREYASGSTPRASGVDRCTRRGRDDERPIVAGQGTERANTCPSSATQLIVRPPSSDAETLSACTSRAVAARSRSRPSCGPASRSNSRRPGDQSPRRCCRARPSSGCRCGPRSRATATRAVRPRPRAEPTLDGVLAGEPARRSRTKSRPFGEPSNTSHTRTRRYTAAPGRTRRSRGRGSTWTQGRRSRSPRSGLGPGPRSRGAPRAWAPPAARRVTRRSRGSAGPPAAARGSRARRSRRAPRERGRGHASRVTTNGSAALLRRATAAPRRC